MILLVLGLAWIIGIYAGSLVRLPAGIFLVALLPLVFIFTRRYRKKAVIGALAIVLFTWAALYSHAFLFDITPGDVRYYNDLGETRLEGRVADDPDVRNTGTRLVIEAWTLSQDEGSFPVEGKVLVFVPRYPVYRYGDVLAVTGEPLTPPVLDDFDYRGYLEHQGITTVMYYPSIEVLDTGRGSSVMVWIYPARSRLADSLAEALPEPQASLAQGMLLGVRGNIPDDVRDDFNRSGTAHLLAISGLHLGVVAGILLVIGVKIFGRRHGWYIVLALGGIWVYTILTGCNPPVLRGAVMVTVFLVAEALGRQKSGLAALVVAAAVMTGLEPHILGDASFQLSFLAMAGLVAVYPLLYDFGNRLVTRLLGEERASAIPFTAVVSTLAATLAATLAVWPVVAYYFGTVSLAGPLATFLALPALPFVIILGGLASIAGLVVPVAGQVAGWLAWPFLSWLLLVTGWLGSGMLSTVTVVSIHPAVTWAYYIIAALIIWYINRWKKRRSLAAGAAGFMAAGIKLDIFPAVGWKRVLVPLAIAALLTVTIAAVMPDEQVKVSFLDVGQGDAVLVRQGTVQVLIDGGPGPQAITAALGERMPFWDRTIEAVVLTHPHGDHLAGLVEVLRRYEVKQVIVPPMEYDSTLYQEWQRLIEEKVLPAAVVSAGYRLDIGDMSFRVLHPLPGICEGGDENALVLRLETGDISFLFASDIPGEVERDLVRRRADIDADVLKVAHHGSDGSSLTAFLAVVSPEVAVISCGEGNRYGHPGMETMERLTESAGKNVFRTDEDGSIDFILNDGRLTVEIGH